MTTPAKDFLTNLTYPVYTSKAAMMNDLRNAIEGTLDRDELWEILYRISATNTGGFADPTVTVATAEAAE